MAVKAVWYAPALTSSSQMHVSTLQHDLLLYCLYQSALWLGSMVPAPAQHIVIQLHVLDGFLTAASQPWSDHTTVGGLA